MHDLNASIPAFLAKLWKLVDDPDTDDLICWSSTGQSFIITNSARFTKELLPMYYKHNNLASFIRQLNMYGFHKVVSIESGGLKSGKDLLEFSHTCFIKGHPYLMENIKRKLSSGTRSSAPLLSYVKDLSNEGNAISQGDILAQVLNDVNSLKSKQASWDAKLSAMKRENETLWRELAIFRQKHHKQEQIINKLIHFIVTMVQPSARNVPLRRRYPLMLNDVLRSPKAGVSGTSAQSSGPTIRELDPTELLIGEIDAKDKSSKSSTSYIIPNFIDDDDEIPNEDASQFVTAELTENPYVVLSPESNTTEDAACSVLASSPWLHADLSDTEVDEMTPIDPLQVTSDIGQIKKMVTTNPEPSSSSAEIWPQVKTKKSAASIPAKKAKLIPALSKPSGKKSRKNAKPKKSIQMFEEDGIEGIANDELFSKKESLSPLGIRIEDDGLSCTPDNMGVKILKMSPIMETDDVSQPSLGEGFLQQEDETTQILQGNNDTLDLALVKSNPICNADDLTRYGSDMELGNHVDSMQGDIDILKEFLKGENCSLDASTFLELFNDDPLAYNMPPVSESKDKEGVSSGQELMTYAQPNLLDLVDLYGSNVSSSIPPSPTPSVLDTPQPTPLSPDFRTPGGKRRRK